jgi:hypothetical protein
MKKFQHSKRVWVGAALLAISAVASQGLEVKTLGGGPTPGNLSKVGSRNGNTLLAAKFNQPFGIAVKADGNLIIADHKNNKLREVIDPGDLDFSITTTFGSKVPLPNGVTVDQHGNIYSVNERNGTVSVFNSSGIIQQTFGGLSKPTAVAVDTQTNIYVTELRGTVQKISGVDFTISEIASGFRQPRGITVLNSATLAVSDTGGHGIYTIDLISSSVTLLSGNNGAGFNDGPGATAKFNQPWGITRAPNGSLVVADRMNHRVRIVLTNGFTFTVYGGGKEKWTRPFAGWKDGDQATATAREPVGVAVGTNGSIYVTEKYWNILREVTGAPVINASTNIPGPGSTNPIPLVDFPTFGPMYGFHPMGTVVTVTSSVPVYYTFDGTEPTVNSRQVSLNNYVGQIRFAEHDRDLRSLRLKAIDGTNASVTVSGVAAPANEVGIPRDIVAGSGSTIVVPVVVNMKSNSAIRSIQFRVEVTPLNGGPSIRPQFRAVSMLSNDFIRVATAAKPNTVATYDAVPYTIGTTRGLKVSALGSDANFLIDQFACAAMLIVPISPDAVAGNTYRIEVLYPSATSDANQDLVPITTMPARTITIASVPYVVGDASPGGWYNAGDFGDGDLENDDVNAVFYASHGIYAPFPETDAFSAMDSYPTEEAGSINGDGFIDFFDLNTVLERSLRLSPFNWSRYWTDGGVIMADPATLQPSRVNQPVPPLAAAAAAPAPVPPGPQAFVGAGTLANANPGDTYEVPVYLNVIDGFDVGGLSIRASIVPEGNAPAMGRVTFRPVLGQGNFMWANGVAPNEVLCSWLLVPSPAFVPALVGNNVVGYLQFTVPNTATAGQSYTIKFPKLGGGPNMSTPYLMEGVSQTFSIWSQPAPAKP